MSPITQGRVAGCLVVALSIGLYAAWGQDGGRAGNTAQAQPGKSDGAKEKRTVYVAKYGSAKDLASTLTKHFKGDAEVQVLTDAESNCLLISAAPAVFEEVLKLLAQLDRRPQLVSVELLVAEVPAVKGDDGKLKPADLDEKEFTGPINEVVTKLGALQKKGQISGLKRLQLTAVENQPTSMQIGEVKPIVTAVRVAAGGMVARSITYRDFGTSARLTLRVAPEKVVMLDLLVQDARPHVPEDGIPLGKDENGIPIRATEFLNARVDAKLSVPSGQALAVQGVKTESKSGQAQTLIVVTARLVESGK